MSLQVWLPLNGNLNNQGLSNITVTNNGATVDNSGKIGKCYSINDVIDLGYSGSNLNTNSISLCCWVRFNTSDISSILNSQSYTSTNKSANGNIIGNNSYGGFSLQWYTNDIYTSGSFSNISVVAYLRTSTVGAKSTTSVNLPLDSWNQLCAICDKNLNKCSLYLNGNLINSFTFTNFSDATDRTFKLNYRATAGGNYLVPQIPILMNDVRIYDHALSAKEVEEIAKGLVLHYKLDDTYSESTTNLITTVDGLSNTCYNGATSKYGYGTNTDMYKTTGTFQGKFCTKVYMGTAGNNAYPYVYFDPFNAKGTEIQTLSFDYYPTIQNTLIPYSYNGSYNFSYTSNGISGSATNASQIIIPVNVGQWNHITITAQKYDTTNTSRGIGYVRIGYSAHTSTTTDYWLFANVQVEAKDHATGYTGVGGSRTATTVYDSSGYGNNGTIIGSLETVSDSSRYSYATKFDGTSSTIKVTDNNIMAQGAQTMTINLWAKTSTWPTTGHLFSCTESGGFNLEAGNSGYWRFPIHVYTNAEQTSTAYKYDSKEIQISALPTNEWVMLTCIYDATGTKTYINGELHHTYSNVSYGIHFNTGARLFLGCEASGANPTTPYFNGQMSDFRMYYTALTPEQIKELYNTSMSIDNNGNIHARELVEV